MKQKSGASDEAKKKDGDGGSKAIAVDVKIKATGGKGDKVELEYLPKEVDAEDEEGKSGETKQLAVSLNIYPPSGIKSNKNEDSDREMSAMNSP